MDSSQQVLRLGLEHRPGQPTGTIRLTLCHALVIVGLFPWLLVNAVYTQLPSFIATLPEGAHIASRIIVSVSVGNLLMLIFVLSTKSCSEKRSNDLNAVVTTSLALLSIVLGALLGRGWQWTAGGTFSYGILALSLASGAVGSISNVTIWPFAAYFGPKAVLYLGIGTALSAAPPTLLAILQRPGEKHQLFSTSVYFYCQIPLLVVSLIGVFNIQRHYVQARSDTRDASASESLLARLVDDQKDGVTEDTALVQLSVIQDSAPGEWKNYSLQVVASSMYYFVLGVLQTLTKSIGSPAATLLYATVANILGGATGRILSVYSQRQELKSLAILQFLAFAAIILVGEAANHSVFPHRSSSTAPLSCVAFVCLCGLHSILSGYISNGLFGKSAALSRRNATKYMGFAEQAGASVSSIIAFLVVQYTTIL